MSQRIDAIFENGVFRPEVPVNIPNGERVSLDVERQHSLDPDLADVEDLLDFEYMSKCQTMENNGLSIQDVRKMLSIIPGSVSDLIDQERNEQ